jgi:glycosyltransferase involved in cell wall biosynthesis
MEQGGGIALVAVPVAGGRAALSTLLAGQDAPLLLLLGAGVELAAGSLEAMRKVMDAHDDCAAVGLRLLAGDGRIRQAGGVVWSDGSRCHYGAGWAADDPRCLYLREVDYCSGRALLLRREALDAIDWPGVDGGLDWADVELGFALRQGGWRVLYCPSATATVHAARVDLHDDVGSDIVGERVFRERHAEALGRQFAPCRQMSRARERSGERPMVLVVDHYLPRVDRDAGSRAIVQAMDAMRALGWQVKFWPANGVHDGHASALEEVGIEVVCGEHWEGRIERLARVAGDGFDAVVLSRPEQAEAAVRHFRAHSRARLLYYAHDLHHARMALEATVAGNPALAVAAAEMQAREQAIWRSVDAVLCPSGEEAAVVAAAAGAARVHVVPLYAFDEAELSAARPPADGPRLLFVAGFGHSPNIDAAHWLVDEILPRLQAELPGLRLDLVGSHPTPGVRALADREGVEVHADVSADTLSRFYREATLAVVPLRIGAGVKLKVLEAMARGVPVVTTPVGLQGLPGAEACVRVGDDTESVARAVLGLLGDPGSAAAVALAARAYVRSHYTAEGLTKALRDALATA